MSSHAVSLDDLLMEQEEIMKSLQRIFVNMKNLQKETGTVLRNLPLDWIMLKIFGRDVGSLIFPSDNCQLQKIEEHYLISWIINLPK